jgi:hypothetical protein
MKNFQSIRCINPARNVPELEHWYRSPGCPFIVNASETLGAAPVRVAWFTTSIGFLFHHSPVNANRTKYFNRIELKLKSSTIRILLIEEHKNRISCNIPRRMGIWRWGLVKG